MDTRYSSPGRVPTYQSTVRGGYLNRSRDTSVLDDAGSLMTSYVHYPVDRPFINDDYRRSPARPTSTYPESERQGRDIGVMSALKGLQKKIRHLELERSQAEGNLKTLATETSHFRNMLEQEKAHTAVSQTTVSKQSQQLESQLQSAESRCNLLERQLEHMRRMVENAERDKHLTLQRTSVLGREKDALADLDLKTQQDKISELEKMQLKLTSTHAHAENRIRDLQDKLLEETHYRKVLQDKASEMQTVAETNRILLEAATSPPRFTQKQIKKVKKKRKPVVSKKEPLKRSVDPSNHYKINLKEIPFVAGQSTTASHSVGANVQGVLSLMKSHNPKLCAAAAKNGMVRKQQQSRRKWSLTSSSEEDLTELLLQLQDEFGQMSFEHQELTKQINDVTDYRTRQDLERELEHLVGKMEAKGDQITKLKRHQQLLQEKKAIQPKPRSKSATTNTLCQPNGEVEVTTTIKTKGPSSGPINVRPLSAGSGRLHLLKDMRKLQTSLRKDDLSWDS